VGDKLTEGDSHSVGDWLRETVTLLWDWLRERQSLGGRLAERERDSLSVGDRLRERQSLGVRQAERERDSLSVGDRMRERQSLSGR